MVSSDGVESVSCQSDSVSASSRVVKMAYPGYAKIFYSPFRQAAATFKI